MHCEGPKSTVRVLYRISGAPARLLLDEGMVGGQGAVWRARVEVQHLGPRAPANRHPTAATSSW